MSRRLQQDYVCSALAELSRQLLYAPEVKRVDQVHRAERLYDEIDPEATYPLDFLWYRITGHRRESDDGMLLVGEAVLPDLRLLIDAVSRSVDLAVSDTAPGSVLLPAEAAAAYQISQRTLMRWRKDGLRWRWVIPPHGKAKCIAFTRRALESYVASHDARAAGAAQYSHIPDAERALLIAHARTMLQTQPAMTLNQVAHRLAAKSGRALETLRQLLGRASQDPREPPLPFAPTGTRLTPRQKAFVLRAARRGVGTQPIADRLGCGRASVYRLIHMERARHVVGMPVTCVPQRTYDRPDADVVYFRMHTPTVPAAASPRQAMPSLAAVPEALHHLYAEAPLGDHDVRSLLLRYNYLKFKARGIQTSISVTRPRAVELNAFDGCLTAAEEVRTAVVRGTLRVVLSVVRRHLLDATDVTPGRLVALLLIGHDVLFETIEIYDAARPAAFESFLTNRLMQRFLTDSRDAEGRRSRALRRSSEAELVEQVYAAARRAGVDLAA